MNNEFKEIEDIEVYNYEATRKNLDSLLAKYRTYKSKKTTIEERIKNSIDLDNLGIFSSRKSDPTYNKVEQLERINNFIDTVDKVIKLNKNKLSKDEYLILKKCLDYKYTTEQISEMINLGYQATFTRKKNCYIRVALWFDLEVYN
ncbi:MAG: hypothetical protein J6B98_06580 [Bacilli bacterium]|nr:hypothetical protein [Bacilli bacterium]